VLALALTVAVGWSIYAAIHALTYVIEDKHVGQYFWPGLSVLCLITVGLALLAVRAWQRAHVRRPNPN
jgi:hypothetical protein